MTSRRGRSADRGGDREPLTVRIDQAVRPVRFGFVVEPHHPDSVMRAIQAATVTWGGRFSPLIPRFKRKTTWDDGRAVAPDEIMRGLIDAFEPDMLVTDSQTEPARLGYHHDRVTSVGEMLAGTFEERPGLPMAHVYQALYEQEFRFQQRHPRRLLSAVAASDASTLLHAAMFGHFPTDPDPHRARFARLGGEDEIVDASALLPTLWHTYTPLRLTVDLLKYQVAPALLIFVLDPKRVVDIIDYWNLRASGWQVLPLPADTADIAGPSLRQLLAPGIAAGSWLVPPTFVKSRSLGPEEFTQVVRQVNMPAQQVSLRLSVPRLLPRGARYRGDAAARDPVAATTSHSVPALGQIQLTSPSLEWLAQRIHAGRTLAVSIRMSMHVESELARSLPLGVPSAGELFRVTSWPNLFFRSSSGLVRLAHGSSSTLQLAIPSADDVWIAWFDRGGLTAAPSNAGRLARQMQRILPTPLDASGVLRKPVLDAFAKAARSVTRAVGDDALAEALHKVHGTKPGRADRHRERLIRADVIRPGMLASCPHCEQLNWYAFDALEAIVECDRCVNRFELPVSRPPGRAAWGFRLRGAFAVGGAAQGAYGVLAVFAALSRAELLDDVTWSSGLDLSAGEGRQYEVDFVFCGRERAAGPGSPPIIALGEAKTGGAFGEPGRAGKQSGFGPAELRKARALAESLPDVGFVFATLAPSLKAREQRALSAFVRAQRRARRGPVLVFTARELLANESFLSVWHDVGVDSVERHLATHVIQSGSFRAAAEATAHLHLGVPLSDGWPSFEEADSALPRRRRRSRTGPAT